jgi:L-threonylcarbamoyladenylate synthase
LLKAGELIVCPTESVYGLVADPKNPQAIKKLFAAKKRQSNHSLSIHIADPKDVHDWASNFSPQAMELIQQYFPGPLTLILQKSPHVSEFITGGKQTIGIRCPDHPIAHALIKGMGHGLIMTSANISGQPSPITAAEARAQIGDQVAMIIDDGPCRLGVSSTVVDVTGEKPCVIRQGTIQL